jgi:hypothetical protein
MFTRRTATAAALPALALYVALGAGCASRGSATVAAGAGTGIAPATVPASTTPVTAAAATDAPADTSPSTVPARTAAPETPAPVPVVKTAPKPATIEVEYQPADGATATATISGPNGSHSKSLASGAALFGSLPAGTYSVTVTIDTPSGDPTVGDARQIINGGTMRVGAGEHGVVTCTDDGCTGTL